ncbi:MAG: hypothetical protein KDD52_09600, partial [Bdellovibrionales bacterium]|nr:hypothetical protein [Bdellovibrionales bacterium]
SVWIQYAHRFYAYQEGYWARFEDIIKNIFSLTDIVFSDQMKEWTHQAMQRYPSTYYSIDFIGESFLRFLKENQTLSQTSKRIAQDLSNLDWTLSRLYQLPRKSPFDLSSFAKIDAARWKCAQLTLQDSIEIMPFQWNLFDFNQKETVSLDEIKENSIHLLIYKDDDQSVYYEKIEASEYLLLKSLREGNNLLQSIQNSQEQNQERIQNFFHKWFEYGLFTDIQFSHE